MSAEHLLAIAFLLGMVITCFLLGTFWPTQGQNQTQEASQVQSVLVENAQAEERAKQLLFEILTPGQRSQLESQGYVEILSGLPVTYRVCAKQGGYADLFLGERRLGRLCIATVSPVPWPDTAIAHILNTRFNEGSYLEKANVVSRKPPLT